MVFVVTKDMSKDILLVLLAFEHGHFIYDSTFHFTGAMN